MPAAGPVIAVLDDEPEMRKALRRLLNIRGFQVAEYERGEDLLAAVDNQRLDYVLLDLQMPGMKGFDVLEAFRARRVAVPVIVITAHDEPGTAEKVQALGAVAYLTKPVDRDALLGALAAAEAHTKPADPPSALPAEEHT